MFLEAQTFALLAFSLIYRGYCVTFLSVDASKPKNRFDKSKSCRPRINREAPSIWQSFNSFFETFRKELKKNFQKIIFCIPSEKTKVPTVLWGKSGRLFFVLQFCSLQTIANVKKTESTRLNSIYLCFSSRFLQL